MPDQGLTRHYAFHGLGLTVHSDHAGILAALDARLRRFAVPPPVSGDLVVRVSSVRASDDHPIRRPAGRGRPVYESAIGEVLYFDADEQLYVDCDGRARVRCAPDGGRAVISIVAPMAADEWLASHPLFTLPLIEVLKRRGLYSLHAAGLCVNGRGVLLAGTSGAGKSTLTIALLRAGFGFLGDDFLFLSESGEGLQVLAFPDEIDVAEPTVEFFPEIRDQLAGPPRPGWPKWQVEPTALYGTPLTWRCPPAVLIFPRVAHQPRSELSPLSPGDALLELAPNVLLTAEASAQAHLAVLTALATRARCYRLDTGRDFDRLPRLIRELVDE